MFTYLHTDPSLISLIVSADVKHHVYILTADTSLTDSVMVSVDVTQP